MSQLRQAQYATTLNQSKYSAKVSSGSYGGVIAFASEPSQNKVQTWGEVYFPELSAQLSQGYMGYDGFAINNNQLVRQFKLYLDGDTNANLTGKTRQISYRLKDGDASHQFVVDKVVEF
ncbi:hypothetical protein [Psychrobacter lutiphocae]|uniref:hypothetical protein n=1 Tax=Psychrobacter lutiphocae TaxID=540500 RepID=UPI00036B23CC|nr:hypothetical protein [Psychrobacter lutiphocae]